MAAGREIHGEVVLDVELGGEERARKRLQESFAKLNAKVNVEATFKRQQVQAALTAQASKGRGLRVNVDAVFSKAQIQRALKEKVTSGKALTAKVDAVFTRSQVQRALKEATTAKPLSVLVRVDTQKGAYTKIVAEAKAAQKAITDIELKEQEKRRTADARSNARSRICVGPDSSPAFDWNGDDAAAACFDDDLDALEDCINCGDWSQLMADHFIERIAYVGTTHDVESEGGGYSAYVELTIVAGECCA